MPGTDSLLSPSLGITLLLVFGVLWVYYGIRLGRRAGDMEGYMLAGRNVGLSLGTATAMATWVTSNTIMLAPKFALQMGVWGMLAYSTASFSLFLFAPMAARIRRLLPNGYTSGDFVRLRYGRTTWYLFLVISLVYSIAWLVSMGMAGGIVLEALSGLDYGIGMSVILLVCVLYTVFGGLYAVIGTDFIQSVIILIGVVTIGAVVLAETDFSNLYGAIRTERPALLDAFMPVALISLFNNMFFGFGEVFHNNVWWSRAYSMRGSVVRKAYGLSGLLWLPIPVAAGFLGLMAASGAINLTDPDMVGPLMAASALGKAGAVFVFVVVFCSLASSIDSLLAATSDLLAEDVFRKIFRPQADDKTLRRFSFWAILGLGALTWVLCILRLSGLIKVLFLSGPLVASLIWPIVCGLYWRNVSRRAADMAILAGSGAGLVCYFTIGWFIASLVSAGVSLVVLWSATRLWPMRYDWNELQEA